MKKTIIAIVIVILVVVGIYFLVTKFSNKVVLTNDQTVATTTATTATTTATSTLENKAQMVIGKSTQGRDIMAYNYGTGETKLLFIGGIHGGYEWNTVLLAQKTMDYLKANPETIPANVKVTVIPVMNPDGLFKVVGTTGSFTQADVLASKVDTTLGRFNANNVDLNRNFDCDWQTTGMWQNKTVSGGSEAFSETESQAVRRYIETESPEAVVVWYSASGGVFSSSCHNGVLPETKKLTNAYAKASGYPAFEEFNFYEITGDMVNWLAKENVSAISVLLTNHTDIEWTKNLAGIQALLKYYTK